VDMKILSAVDAVNDRQKSVIYNKIYKHFDGKLRGKTIAIWGLAFKPQTDDIREAPALVVINRLLGKGAIVKAHDPVAMPNVKQMYGNKIEFCENAYDALDGADALAVITEWNEFRTPDFNRMKKLMKSDTVFDGRNIYDPKSMKEMGFNYYAIGRLIPR